MAKTAKKKAGTTKKNKLGVKNSLVNNINARKKKEYREARKTPRFRKRIMAKWNMIGTRKKNDSPLKII